MSNVLPIKSLCSVVRDALPSILSKLITNKLKRIFKCSYYASHGCLANKSIFSKVDDIIFGNEKHLQQRKALTISCRISDHFAIYRRVYRIERQLINTMYVGVAKNPTIMSAKRILIQYNSTPSPNRLLRNVIAAS